MHTTTKTLFAAFAAFALACASLGAQAAADTPRVNARQHHQQARIAAGGADGSLTHHEARHLHAQQRHIRQAERHAKADGVVTRHERQHLARLQQHANRSIHHQRHDAQQRQRPAA